MSFIKRTIGTCDGKQGRYKHCGATDVPLACKSRGQCSKCSYEHKKNLTGTAPYKRKLQRRKASGELPMFLEIWRERPHFCEIHMSIGQRVPIREFNICNYMHILSKGAFPAFRLKKENVALGCLDCAHQQNTGSIENDPKFVKWHELHEELKREYYSKTR